MPESALLSAINGSAGKVGGDDSFHVGFKNSESFRKMKDARMPERLTYFSPMATPRVSVCINRIWRLGKAA